MKHAKQINEIMDLAAKRGFALPAGAAGAAGAAGSAEKGVARGGKIPYAARSIGRWGPRCLPIA